MRVQPGLARRFRAFTRPDLTTFTGLDELGLEITGQLLKLDRAVLACRVLKPDDWCSGLLHEQVTG